MFSCDDVRCEFYNASSGPRVQGAERGLVLIIDAQQNASLRAGVRHPKPMDTTSGGIHRNLMALAPCTWDCILSVRTFRTCTCFRSVRPRTGYKVPLNCTPSLKQPVATGQLHPLHHAAHARSYVVWTVRFDGRTEAKRRTRAAEGVSVSEDYKYQLNRQKPAVCRPIRMLCTDAPLKVSLQQPARGTER